MQLIKISICMNSFCAQQAENEWRKRTRTRVDRRRHCGETGAQTRATCAKDGYWHKLQLLFTWRTGISRELLWTNPWKPKQPHGCASSLCVTKLKRCSFQLKATAAFCPSSPCLRACFSTTLAPIHAEFLFLHTESMLRRTQLARPCGVPVYRDRCIIVKIIVKIIQTDRV